MLRFVMTISVCLMANGCFSTVVKPCKTGPELSNDKVSITDCEKEPCLFRRGTNLTITMYFTPDAQIDKLVNNVFAFAMGMKTPYPGVDGKNACDLIYLASDGSKSVCPLQPGIEYYYNYDVHIKKIYPKVNGLLHWAIKEKGATDTVACFEVDISIV